MHGHEKVDVQGSEMEVFLFRPESEGAHPALILAQHIPVGHAGLEHDEFTLRAAERFCAAGYVVAAPFIFHWWPKTADLAIKREQSRDDWMVADIEATFTMLARDDQVDPKRIGIVGHCWGGRVAWLGACHLDVAACAIFYGGRVKVGMGDNAVPPITLASQIRCPVAGYFGDEDQNPTPADVDDYASALSDAGVSFDFHRYPGAGHAFQNFPSPERYREAQSEDAWKKVLAFFGSHLAA